LDNQAVTVARSGEVDNPRGAALMERGGVRKAQVDPDVASSSELILALVDDLITGRVMIGVSMAVSDTS